MAGFVNVDKYGAPDVKCDLEVFPWPWETSSVDEVLLHHSLEHMGQSTETFTGIMKELYRVCANGAIVHIAVPHPRHDSFLDDPTHVRVITPELMGCFSKAINLQAQKDGAANSPLAMYHDVDFAVQGATFTLDEPYDSEHKSGKLGKDQLSRLMRLCNNVAKEWRIDLRVIKENNK